MANKKRAAKTAANDKRQAVQLGRNSKTQCEWDLDFKINHHHKLTKNQQMFLDYAQSKTGAFDDHEVANMCIVDGPAGTAKTYIGVLAAINLLQSSEVESIVYIRSIVESASRQLGSLPGELEEKFAPWSMPLIDKLDELLPPGVGNNLLAKEYIKCIPVNFTRGLTFRDTCVIVDEAQNLTQSELTTILTRFGYNSKYIVVGDSNQSDINGKSGFSKIFDAFNHNSCIKNGIRTFKFNGEDIVRSKILRFIVDRLDTIS